MKYLINQYLEETSKPIQLGGYFYTPSRKVPGMYTAYDHKGHVCGWVNYETMINSTATPNH